MLGSLRARLIISFALVVALAVFLAGASALFLLRDRQQNQAQERYGRIAVQLNTTVAEDSARRVTQSELTEKLTSVANESAARIILLDQDQQVTYDSAGRLGGKYILSFENSPERVNAGGLHYRWTNYNSNGEHLVLFTSDAPEASTQFAAIEQQALVAIPQDELASAWLALVPRLALAGAIALAVSFAVSYFISRSISGPLGRITEASIQMAGGDYNVHIPIRGQDEVGRLSEAFNAMAKEVNRSQRMMKDLLANVSHELKTPLTSIQGYSQAMLDGAVSSEEDFRESSRIIHEEANRMRALVDDILLLSQIESGQVAMQHAHVDLRALLERTMERFQWALREAGIESGLHVATVIPAIHGDERRLEQVFSNLIENAVRHTPRGGVVNVSAILMADGKIQATVHNTGSVIPPEDLPRVFERFFQVDRARTRKGKAGSSGLGLSIVSEIVEAHGGSVRAESSVRYGTEFIVTLPDPRPATNGRNDHREETKRGRERVRPIEGRELPAG